MVVGTSSAAVYGSSIRRILLYTQEAPLLVNNRQILSHILNEISIRGLDIGVVDTGIHLGTKPTPLLQLFNQKRGLRDLGLARIAALPRLPGGGVLPL